MLTFTDEQMQSMAKPMRVSLVDNLIPQLASSYHAVHAVHAGPAVSFDSDDWRDYLAGMIDTLIDYGFITAHSIAFIIELLVINKLTLDESRVAKILSDETSGNKRKSRSLIALIAGSSNG